MWHLACLISRAHRENPLGHPISHCLELNNISSFSLRALDKDDAATKSRLVELHIYPICRFIPCCHRSVKKLSLGQIARWESLEPGHTYFTQHGWLPQPDCISNNLARQYETGCLLLKRIQMKDVRHISVMNSSVNCVPQHESPIPGSR